MSTEEIVNLVGLLPNVALLIGMIILLCQQIKYDRRWDRIYKEQHNLEDKRIEK